MRLRGTRAYAAPDMTRIAAILPAAGMGTRMGAETPKQFLELNGTPIVILSLRRIASCTLVTDLIVATRADEIQRSEEHTSELQSRLHLVCRLLLEKKIYSCRRDPFVICTSYYSVVLGFAYVAVLLALLARLLFYRPSGLASVLAFIGATLLQLDVF